MASRKRIFTWHIHGSYLYYLVQAPHEFYIPVREDSGGGYGGKGGPFPWPDNLHEIPESDVPDTDFDLILYQSRDNYLTHQYQTLSKAQRQLPRIYLEHDPPREHPTDTVHIVDDPSVLLVHVTPFNDLMWDSRRTPTRVIDHGVIIPEGVEYNGEIDRGLVVVNHIKRRGRRLGADIFERARQQVPLDYVGMGWEEVGGLGEVPHPEIPAFEARYRFFFNPIRYTSLGLAVLEAMMAGMPIVGLATTEMATVIENGVSGYVDTDVDKIVDAMHCLLEDPAEARRLGEGARRTAQERFNIQRFVEDWNDAFNAVAGA